MLTPTALSQLLELLHRALKAQAHYAMDHPQAAQTSQAAYAHLTKVLGLHSPLVLTLRAGRLCFQGKAVEGAPSASLALAKELESHNIGGVAFHAGFDEDELQVLFFTLQLRPQRLAEMGGPDALLPEGSNLRFLPREIQVDEAFQTDPEPQPEPELEPEPIPLEPEATAPEPPIPSPLPDPVPAEPPVTSEHSQLEPGDLTILFAPPAPVVETVQPPQPPAPADLALDLRTVFGAVLHMAEGSSPSSTRSAWSRDQREVLEENGFQLPDFTALMGVGAQLGLGRMDPIALREAVRRALSGIDPMNQGTILLGLPAFPSDEQALRRALDYLAPELLAQALAEVHVRRHPSLFALALLAAAFLQCVKDRELSLEAIRGRLQFEGWTLEDLDELKEAILWECHGTDTKLHLSLTERSLFELDPQQVMILSRQLLRARKPEGIRDLLEQLAGGFSSPSLERRRQASEILADLAEGLDEPGLALETEERILELLHQALVGENDAQAALWCAQGVEAMLGHWLRETRFEGVYREMLSLGEMALPHAQHPAWKVQGVRDLLTRLASPLHLAFLTPLLHQRDGQVSIPQLQALLVLLGRAAADYLVVCLGLEEDATRRGHLASAIRALGRNAATPLREALANGTPGHAREAALILGEIGHREAWPDLVRSLVHPEAQVRRAAASALAQMGPAGEASEALGQALLTMDPATQLDLLTLLGELKHPAAIPALGELLRNPKGQGDETLRVRLRAVEVIGLIASPDGIEPLRELFRKKGLLGGRESTAIRLAAARSLASINTRDSREAIALALDAEPHEEVRAVLRQYLVQQ